MGGGAMSDFKTLTEDLIFYLGSNRKLLKLIK